MRPSTTQLAATGLVLIAACSKGGLSDTAAAAARASCSYTAGALPAATLAADVPIGAKIPVNHIILIMQENRSFDHYFSGLTNGADVASPTVTNPAPDGTPIQRFHATDYCIVEDVNHSWDGVHTEFDNGKMDGFAIANADPVNDPTGARAMGYFDATDLPFYYSLAETFGISDRHFCSAPGDTAPNREYFAAATSRGAVDETVLSMPQTDAAGNQLPNIYSVLQQFNVSWKFYSAGVTPQFGSLLITNETFGQQLISDNSFYNLDDFYSDLSAGTLPSVAFVDEAVTDPETCLSDEHPTKDPQLGQKFISNVVTALFASPHWADSALFVTWDEHGGFYDHVYPPPACLPDAYTPVTEDGGVLIPEQGAFNIYGPRVPLLLVSPYAKRGHVSHEVTDHASLLRFVEARFNLPAMTNRDANAEPPYDMFDFDHPDLSIPQLAPAVINQDPSYLQNCSSLASTCTF